MRDGDRSVFPAADVAERLSKRLYSRNASGGISELLGRLSAQWQDLRAAWIERGAPDGAKSFGLVLLRVIETADSDDLFGLDVPLRALDHPLSVLHGDANVRSKIGQALIETLAEGDISSMLETVQAMTAQDNPRLTFLANLVAIPLYIETKQFDFAIAAAKSNVSVTFCPTSAFMLFKSMRAKNEAGLPVSHDVSIHDLSDRFCSQPFDTLSTSAGRGGRPGFFACGCSATLPYPLANRQDDFDIDAIWNGEDISEIRRSILDGDFTYCSRTMCPYIAQGTLPKRSEITDPFLVDIIDNHRLKIDRTPVRVTLGHDPSCNLACPSCRTEIIALKNEERRKLDDLSDKLVLPLIADSSATLFVCTDGDPFASKHYRRLIHSLDAQRHAGVKLQLLTNGLLFTREEWESLGHVQKLIQVVIVSIDGARQETYENLRRPGKWDKIVENMELMKRLRQENEIQGLYLHFVVQKENLEEMVEFVELGKHWNIDGINFIRMTNLGSFSAAVFEDKDVSNPRHPLHERLLEILRHPVLHDPRVNLLSLAPLQAAADAKAGFRANDL